MPPSARWRAVPPRDRCAATLRDWLRERGSLTARLMRHGSFRVAVLRQSLLHANPDERVLFALRPGARCHVREVVLYCDGVPVIYAHTVLPAEPRGTLSRWFARLGSRSLGSLLFTHPGFVRGSLAYARIDHRHPLFAPAAAQLAVPPATFSARRCLHRYGTQAVLVSEVFLPAIEQLPPLQ